MNDRLPETKVTNANVGAVIEEIELATSAALALNKRVRMDTLDDGLFGLSGQKDLTKELKDYMKPPDGFADVVKNLATSQITVMKATEAAGTLKGVKLPKGVALRTDGLTGLHSEENRLKVAVHVLGELNKGTFKSACYVELDIRNLGGLNRYAEWDSANVVFRRIADILRIASNTLLKDGIQVETFRHGGDELSLIAASSDPDQAKLEKTGGDVFKKAMGKGSGVEAMMKAAGLDTVPHRKHTDPAFKGVGMVWFVAPMTKKQKIGDAFHLADTALEKKKSDPKQWE